MVLEMRERLDPRQDAISEERIDKRVVKHDKIMFVDKISHF